MAVTDFKMADPPAMEDLEQISVEDMFKLLESNRKHVVEEVQRLIHQQFTESKDSSWLINGLYEYYNATQSVNGLKILLNIKEPLDVVLCDRIYEGLKSSEMSARVNAINMLGFIARKQPTWMYKITSTQCFRELLKLLRHEPGDLVLLVTGLLVLLTLLPAVPAKVSPFLAELFEVFGRLAALLHAQTSAAFAQTGGGGPKEQAAAALRQQHLHVALYAYFNRLYGMFPCNFLSWLRQQYPETGREVGVFSSVVAPLLSTVRMHPLLVTHSKEHEKSSARWKGLGEVHDVLAECSRYSLDTQESGSREDTLAASFLEIPLTPGSALTANLDPTWTPGKFFEVGSPGPTAAARDKKRTSNTALAVRCIESPPEAAIEATPENTPYATPVKEEAMRLTRKLPSSHVIRNLMKSPGPAANRLPLSPLKDKETSPFRFSEDEMPGTAPGGDLHGGGGSGSGSVFNKRDSLGLGNVESLLANKIKSLAGDREENKMAAADQAEAKMAEHAASTPKVTGEAVDKPADVAQEDTEDDNEVSSLTDCASVRPLDTRHITPHIFPESAGGSTPVTPGSRAQSRVSHAGSVTPFQVGEHHHDSKIMSPVNIGLTPASDMDSPTPFSSINNHRPSRQQQALAVDEFVQSVRKRVRYITLCEPQETEPSSEEMEKEDHDSSTLQRSSSCPLLLETGSDSKPRLQRSPIKTGGDDETVKLRSTSGTQTDEGMVLLPWEHLFPASLPCPSHKAGSDHVSPPDPYDLLDRHIEAAVLTLDKTGGVGADKAAGHASLLRDEIALLHSHLLFERQRREVLGARNRRLLGKTKNFRDLEEKNLALNDQLQMAQSEISTLHNQLGSLRAEKHEAETQWSTSTHQQEEKCIALQAESENLKMRITDLEAKLEESLKNGSEWRAEAENSKADLFQATAKLEKYKGKESKWEQTEAEMEKMKKRMLLQSELISSYKQTLENRPAKTNQQQIRLITEAAETEVAAMKTQLAARTSELSLATATIADLEMNLEELNKNMELQVSFLEQTQEEYKTNLKAMEDRYSGMRSINSHFEISILELQDRLESLKTSRRGRKVLSPSSDSLDLRGDLSLMQTSSTSSVHGSIGSDPGEHIRRALEAPNPLHINREIEKQVSSPEVGSAQSASQDLVARSPTSSNGQ